MILEKNNEVMADKDIEEAVTRLRDLATNKGAGYFIVMTAKDLGSATQADGTMKITNTNRAFVLQSILSGLSLTATEAANFYLRESLSKDEDD